MKMHAKLPVTQQTLRCSPRKLRTSLAASLTVLCFPAFADGTKPSVALNFTGKYVTQTCRHTGAVRQSVTLPSIPTAALKKAGDTAGDTAFTINLVCEGGQEPVAVSFVTFRKIDGRLISSGTAQNVQVQLLKADGTPIAVGDDSTTQMFPMSSTGLMSLSFIARYYATAATTPGSVTAGTWYFIEVR